MKNKKRLQPLSIVPPESDQAADFYREIAIDTMARTLWGEARGEGRAGMQAVAHVIMNRQAVSNKFGGYWWGNDIVQICQKPYQFSCWNKDDPNRVKLIMLKAENDIHFVTALRIARRALAGCLGDDPTKGATHYHARGISPNWSEGQKPSCEMGRHVFYSLIKNN